VFRYAGAFNGDLSKWQVGEVTTMEASTYTLSPPLQDRVDLAASISLLLSVAALILFLNNVLSSFFFQPIFILGLFFVVVCGAVFRNAHDFNGDLSTWDVGGVTNMISST
jgi:surface protein